MFKQMRIMDYIPDFQSATDDIVQFNHERNLVLFNGQTEVNMLEEELQEFKDAITTNNVNEMINALNDIRVLATGALWKLGQDPEKSLKETTKEILSREGTLNPTTGKWQKNPNQDEATLYRPDYQKSIRR